jgi:hypothetical protein
MKAAWRKPAVPCFQPNWEVLDDERCGHMRQSSVIRLIPFLLLTSTGAPAREGADKPCREHPRLIGRCFTVHGRLSVYNGAPALRLWKTGTPRMLGISEQRFAVAGYRNLPENIEKQINQDVAIFGDFLVCPFTRPKPGEMQLVCIDSGKNLFVRRASPASTPR